MAGIRQDHLPIIGVAFHPFEGPIRCTLIDGGKKSRWLDGAFVAGGNG